MCPVCETALLIYELDGIEVDHCPACRGTWLDAGELDAIAAAAGAGAGQLRQALEGAGGGRRTGRRCVRCRRRLREAGLGEPQVQIDRCPYGHGLWLDRGEMRAVIVSHCDGDAEEAAVGRFFAEIFRSETAAE